MDAMAKKDPDELAVTLQAIENKVPPGKIPEKDRSIQQIAKNMAENLNAQQGIC